jgi:hypothetical protein
MRKNSFVLCNPVLQIDIMIGNFNSMFCSTNFLFHFLSLSHYSSFCSFTIVNFYFVSRRRPFISPLSLLIPSKLRHCQKAQLSNDLSLCISFLILHSLFLSFFPFLFFFFSPHVFSAPSHSSRKPCTIRHWECVIEESGKHRTASTQSLAFYWNVLESITLERQ